MPRTGAEKILYLDGWRGLAILLVLIGHFGNHHRAWLGPFGVLLFFVLSGLLMSRLLFIKQVALKNFFIRRFSRVVPTFFLYTLVIAVYAKFLQPSAYDLGLTELTSTLSFMRTYFPADVTITTRQWPIGHFWSLNVEEHTYLFLAAGTLVCRRIGGKFPTLFFLTISTVIVLVINFFYMASPPAGASPWYLRSECAALGIIAAAALTTCRHHFQSTWIQQIPALCPIITFIVATICVSTYAHKGVDKTIAPLCLAFSIVYLDRAPRFLRTLLSARPLQWLGTCSFSLYLWQQVFFLSVLKYGTNPLLGVGLAVISGTLSFYYFESPMRNFINRAWERYEEKISRESGTSSGALS